MKTRVLILAVLTGLLPAVVGWSQDEKDLPSQKTKEAIDKFKKAPSAVGKALESLKEAGKAKLEGLLPTKDAKAPTKAGDVAMPEKKPGEPQTPRYSAAGRRDPFEPMRLRTTKAAAGPRREPRSPLERYDLGQLKLVAILWGTKEARAMVEDSGGLGYIIKVGTPIGSNDGKVKEIKPTEVVIEETVTDFYGARKNRDVSLKLKAE